MFFHELWDYYIILTLGSTNGFFSPQILSCGHNGQSSTRGNSQIWLQFRQDSIIFLKTVYVMAISKNLVFKIWRGKKLFPVLHWYDPFHISAGYWSWVLSYPPGTGYWISIHTSTIYLGCSPYTSTTLV